MSLPATRRRRLWAEFLLATVTVFWGSTFPVVKDAVAQVPVLCFLWVRFALAALLLAALAGPRLAGLGRRGWTRGVVLGTVLFLAYLFQTFGLERTSAANAGFLTGLNVVWVPILAGPLLGKRPSTGARIGVVCAVIGLWLLTGSAPWRLGPGDLLVLVCSVFVALHVLGLDALTGGTDARALTFVQVATMAVWAWAGSAAFEPVTWPRAWNADLVTAVVVTAVFATVYAFWVMTSYQRYTTPARAALIYTLEPVFAAVFSVWLAGERLSATAWMGGLLIVVGTLAAELWPQPNAEGEQGGARPGGAGESGRTPPGSGGFGTPTPPGGSPAPTAVAGPPGAWR
ncbi:MAG: DMT family transporter [Deltaproteobacteria bacterium]|nr:DMT family transporter [Deltaproteobacteria bacterium]